MDASRINPRPPPVAAEEEDDGDHQRQRLRLEPGAAAHGHDHDALLRRHNAQYTHLPAHSPNDNDINNNNNVDDDDPSAVAALAGAGDLQLLGRGGSSADSWHHRHHRQSDHHLLCHAAGGHEPGPALTSWSSCTADDTPYNPHHHLLDYHNLHMSSAPPPPFLQDPLILQPYPQQQQQQQQQQLEHHQTISNPSDIAHDQWINIRSLPSSAPNLPSNLDPLLQLPTPSHVGMDAMPLLNYLDQESGAAPLLYSDHYSAMRVHQDHRQLQHLLQLQPNSSSSDDAAGCAAAALTSVTAPFMPVLLPPAPPTPSRHHFLIQPATHVTTPYHPHHVAGLSPSDAGSTIDPNNAMLRLDTSALAAATPTVEHELAHATFRPTARPVNHNAGSCSSVSDYTPANASGDTGVPAMLYEQQQQQQQKRTSSSSGSSSSSSGSSSSVAGGSMRDQRLIMGQLGLRFSAGSGGMQGPGSGGGGGGSSAGVQHGRMRAEAAAAIAAGTRTPTPSHGGARLKPGSSSSVVQQQQQQEAAAAAAAAECTPRPRWCPTAEQIAILESIFHAGTTTPSREMIVDIAAQLRRFGSIAEANVFYWFQNRKARAKRKAALVNSNVQQLQQPQQQQQLHHHGLQPPPPPPRKNDDDDDGSADHDTSMTSAQIRRL